MSKTTADVQRRLIALGFNLGRGGPSDKGDDGIAGALTRNALGLFQTQKGLPVTRLADTVTMAALFPTEGSLAVTPPWFDLARSLKGTSEIVGPKHSPVIMNWAKKLGIWYPSDETAWCGLFVAHCIGATLPNEAMPANPLGARNWAKLGRGITTPALGAVLVFWRGKRTGWEGHVGLYAGERASDGAFRVLGGNQGNTVSEVWLDKERLLDIRWPMSYPLPVARRHYLASNGGNLSTNEA